MAAADFFSVEVVYASGSGARIKAYRVPAAATAADVLKLAAADAYFTGIAIDALAVGIFGRLIARERVLQPGDRLELYRPLPADPKDTRRQRVQRARKLSSATGSSRGVK